MDSPAVNRAQPFTTSSNSAHVPVHHHPHVQQTARSTKRNSVFNIRSKGSYSPTASSFSARVDPPIMGRHDLTRSEPSPTCDSFSRQGHSGTQNPRTSLFRKGKRWSESPTTGRTITDLHKPESSDKRASVLRKPQRPQDRSESHYGRDLRGRISHPFDFRHLTHADRSQFAKLNKSSTDSLAAGFRAVRASQQPSSSLTGIRAEDLHFKNFSSENLIPQDRRSASETDIRSSLQTAAKVNEVQPTTQVLHERLRSGSLRLTRSAEAFSQPVVDLNTHRYSQSVVGPRRLSSLPTGPTDEMKNMPAENQRMTLIQSSRSNCESGVWGAHLPDRPSTVEVSDDSTSLANAVTTPDNVAVQTLARPFTPGLEDVAEEPEPFVHPRAAPRPPTKRPSQLRSPKFGPFVATPQSTISRARPRGNSHSSPRSPRQPNSVLRPKSQVSDMFGPSGIVRRRSIKRPATTRRESNTWRAPAESWEDDIDYIYDNALEADCDLEWGRTSPDEMLDQSRYTITQAKNEGMRKNVKGLQIVPVESNPHENDAQPSPGASQDFRASLLVPDQVPDLEPSSANSVSTSGTGVATLADLYGDDSRPAEDFAVSPSLLVPQQYSHDKDTCYDDLLNHYNDPMDGHFTLIEPSHSAASSARSSRIRCSRRSSYDSSLMSSAKSSGLWSSPVRRSASSTGSIPELVPSRRPRQDLSCSVMIEQLSDSFASLRNLDEEKPSDNDITPPGRTPESQAFFTQEDIKAAKDVQNENDQSAIEDELKASLQMAWRGSQANIVESDQNEQQLTGTQLFLRGAARLHKQTMSDGAAKLLVAASAVPNEPARQRNRAASTSQAIRAPMLNLFPNPPRISPPPTIA